MLENGYFNVLVAFPVQLWFESDKICKNTYKDH